MSYTLSLKVTIDDLDSVNSLMEAITDEVTNAPAWLSELELVLGTSDD